MNNKKTRHVLGISGGKDSAALAIYMKDKHSELDIEYYTSDTGKELPETYKLIDNLEIYLGKKIVRLRAFDKSHEDPFDHKLKSLRGFLPSQRYRWCTKNLKLDVFEEFVGNDPVVSYVGIRGDENREGYISKKPNIQSIFPFRKNIWSEDVTGKFLKNSNIKVLEDFFKELPISKKSDSILEVLQTPISSSFTQDQKLTLFLDLDIKVFNKLVHMFLRTTNYPLAHESFFPLVDNEDVLIREDIFNLLEKSGVGVPAYYKPVEFEVDGLKGTYSRSRSGCYFCFFQQRIEWVWLYEQHPELFKQAEEYEKEGYYWSETESLSDLVKPDRLRQIKLDYLKKVQRQEVKSPFLLDILDDAEEEGCATCFI